MKSSGKMSIFSAVFAMLIIGSVSFSYALAEEGGTPVPHAGFYGSLTLNGNPAPVGTGIKGMVDELDHTAGTYITTVSGQYGSQTFVGKFQVNDCPYGEEVTFSVEISPGQFVNADQTGICEPGNDVNLALTVQSGGEPGCHDYDQDGYSGYDASECPSGTDCDDLNAAINPGATEACNGIDDDCSGAPEADEVDVDQDGYMVCENDCDDNDENINPAANEICNGLDDDCSGDLPANEADADEDGYMVCENDCDDTNGNINPGATEACNGIDDDCSGAPEADEVDVDQDGYMVCENDCDDGNANVNPGVNEICNDQTDNDCDGFSDCLDGECFEFPGCEQDFCIEIEGMRILDQDFQEAATITPGTMYNVEVTNSNTCVDPVQSMQIIQVSEITGQSLVPMNIGTMLSTIAPGTTSVITAGFVLPQDSISGTQYQADAFNWISWGTTQPLSAPDSAGFQAI